MTLEKMEKRPSPIFCILERSVANMTSPGITVSKEKKRQRKEIESTVGNTCDVDRGATKALLGR